MNMVELGAAAATFATGAAKLAFYVQKALEAVGW